MVVHAYRDVQGYRLTRTAPLARPLMAPVAPAAPVRSHRGHGRERSCAGLSGDPYSYAAGRRREEP